MSFSKKTYKDTLIDALELTYDKILDFPDEELRKEVAKGIYWITCNMQHVNVMIY